jgi:hypothetical protein
MSITRTSGSTLPVFLYAATRRLISKTAPRRVGRARKPLQAEAPTLSNFGSGQSSVCCFRERVE